MLGANVVAGYRLVVALGIRRLVVGQRNFDMREPVAARVFEACSLGASAGFAVACRVGLVEGAGVAVLALLANRRGSGHQRHSRRCRQVLARSSMPGRC
jgi:hypothetical protein